MAIAKDLSRSTGEKIFLVFFFPVVIGFYLIYKYPLWFVDESMVEQAFYWGEIYLILVFHSLYFSSLRNKCQGRIVWSYTLWKG